MTSDDTATRPHVMLNLQPVRKLLTTCLELVDDIDGIEVIEDSTRENKTFLADLNRDLHYIADLCVLASAEATNQFHRVKGKPDPRVPSK